ncbi:MAG: cytochrome c3 family protein [Bacillota bacterium]|nr:cytochrome c3 family protein [Bacillota bacterium]
MGKKGFLQNINLGGRFMKKLSLILVLAMVFTLVLAGSVFAIGEDSTQYTEGGKDLVDYIYGDTPTYPDGTLYRPAGENDNFSVGTDPYGTTTPPEGWTSIINANESGLRATGMIKARPQHMRDEFGNYLYDYTSRDNKMGHNDNQLIHGHYENNTNSCASCHMTHTAAGGNLLIRNGVYNTCVACHDGTFGPPDGKYNVLMPTKMFGGGTFGGPAGEGTSVHLATGHLTIGNAPGGYRNYTDMTGKKGLWDKEFTCASCHAPHGSYSSRLIHYNPNNYALRPASEGGSFLSQGTSTIDYGEGNVVTVTGTDPLTVQFNYDSVNGKTYLYVYNDGVKMEQPFLYAYNFAAGHKKVYETRIEVDGSFKDGSNTPYNELWKWDYSKGYATRAGDHTATNITYVQVAPAFTGFKVVDETVYVDTNGLLVAEGTAGATKATRVNYTSGTNEFCATCHTDYQQNRSDGAGVKSPRGTFSMAFRHNMNQSAKANMPGEPGSWGRTNMTCLTCHFAHGTTADIQVTATNEALPAGTADVAASSALKRYVNMSVCWRCHTDSKASALKNNQFFWDNYELQPSFNFNDDPYPWVRK